MRSLASQLSAISKVVKERSEYWESLRVAASAVTHTWFLLAAAVSLALSAAASQFLAAASVASARASISSLTRSMVADEIHVVGGSSGINVGTVGRVGGGRRGLLVSRVGQRWSGNDCVG